MNLFCMFVGVWVCVLFYSFGWTAASESVLEATSVPDVSLHMWGQRGRRKHGESDPSSPTIMAQLQMIKYSAYSDWMTKDLMPKSLFTVWQELREKWSAKSRNLSVSPDSSCMRTLAHTNTHNPVNHVNTPPSALFYPCAFHWLHKTFRPLHHQYLPAHFEKYRWAVCLHLLKDDGLGHVWLHISACFMLLLPVNRKHL